MACGCFKNEWLQEVDLSYRLYFQAEVFDDEESTRMTRKRKKSDKVVGAPDEDDFANARLLMEFLRLFFIVTKKISGSKYATANLVFVEVCKLHASITSISLSEDEKKKAMGESMKAKFEKYWDNLDNVNFLLYVALVLDPRNKLFYLGYSLSLIYGKSDKVKEIKDQVKATLIELYDDYKSKIDKAKEPKSTSCSTTNLVDDEGFVDLEEGYLKYLEEEGGVGVDNNEVEIYLTDGMEKRIKGDDTFDVLGWWKINSPKFPILSQIAKHVLAMPISTVASESAFSTGGRVIDKYRSSLTSKTAEALICAQDWLRSTPSDLQDFGIHGHQLEEFVENLEKIEDDLLNGKKTHKDSTIGDDDDWD